MKSFCTHIIMSVVVCVMMIQCSVSEQSHLPKIPVELLQEGDIAFRRGYGIASQMVLHNDVNGMYSHVGVVVRTDEGLMIVHSVPGDSNSDSEMVRIESVAQFYDVEASQCGAILRMDLNSLQRRRLNSMAIRKACEQIPFDHEYNVNDTSSLYCTELVELLYANIGEDLSEGRMTLINVPGFSNEYIMPSDIYSNKRLRTIFKY